MVYSYWSSCPRLLIYNEMVEQPLLFAEGALRDAIKVATFARLYGATNMELNYTLRRLGYKQVTSDAAGDMPSPPSD